MFQPNRSIQKLQFMKRLLLDLPRQLPGELTLPDFLSLTAIKVRYQPKVFYIGGYIRQQE
jgi:hypothetical protein